MFGVINGRWDGCGSGGGVREKETCCVIKEGVKREVENEGFGQGEREGVEAWWWL